MLPPTATAARIIEFALRISSDLVFFYAAGARNPSLEEAAAARGAKVKVTTEKGELTTDALRTAAIENVDIIIAPDRFAANAKGLSNATDAIVKASPVSVVVIR